MINLKILNIYNFIFGIGRKLLKIFINDNFLNFEIIIIFLISLKILNIYNYIFGIGKKLLKIFININILNIK